MLLLCGHREEIQQLTMLKTGWGGLFIPVTGSSGRWLLKGLWQVATPVTREGPDGLVSGREPCEGVVLGNSGERVETSMDKDYGK